MIVSQGSVRSYAAIQARVRALYANLLDEELWTQLFEAQDIDGTLKILKDTVYAPYLESDDHGLTPRRIVFQIKQHVADMYIKILRWLSEPGRQCLLQLWRLFEVDNLKALLRGLETGASEHQVRFTFFPMGDATVLPTEVMFQTGDITRAIELLNSTPYYGTLKHALKRFTEEKSLFPLEVALDLDYYRELWRSVHKLSGLDRKHALRLIGNIVDMNNLLWAIRYRIYHRLSEEEIINYTLSFGYRVQDSDIRAIAAGGNISPIIGRVYPEIEDVQALIDQPPYGLVELERQLERHLMRECRHTFLGYPFHLGLPMAYLQLCEQEIQDLTVLMEAKASNIPVEDYAPLLIRPLAKTSLSRAI
jgi:V/A-type H+-transporting ATPase subunit C